MGLVVPATANATVLAKITDDAGTPVPLAAGAPPTLRNMDVTYYVNGDKGKYFAAKVIGPDGLPTGTGRRRAGSWARSRNRTTDYHGNGAYTLTVTAWTDKCDGTVAEVRDLQRGTSPPAWRSRRPRRRC